MSRRKIVYVVTGVIITVLVILAFMPDRVPVETAPVTRGAMQVTIDDQGKTRVIDRFTITAPSVGRLERIDLREGAPIQRGDVVARIDPAPLDATTKAEFQALLDAAVSAQREAAAGASRAEAAWELARNEFRRVQGLAEGGVVSQSNVDTARTQEETARRDLAAARARVTSAASNVSAARARLLGTGAPSPSSIVEVRSPAAGRVLRIPDRSSRIVAPGAPILEVGNANSLELVIEVLSEDAVKIRPGNAVIVNEWGGGAPLRGSVRVVEPSAFTKFSALGIEEQRVNVIADVPNAPPSLGDAYRIEASVVIWSEPSAVKVPLSALAREGNQWSVFVIDGGRARRRIVRIGQRNPQEAQVLSGLQPGEHVIVHPGADVKDGVRVQETGG